MSVQCRPGNVRTREGTCLPAASIRKLVTTWNKTHKNKIRVGGTRKNKGSLWSALRGAMAQTYACDNEYCAVKKLVNKKDQTKMLTFFKP